MFHFTLVHVPGMHHRPDGLSWRRPQPGDLDEPEDNFEDWVDQVNGFMHMINASPSHPTQVANLVSTPPIACYVIESTRNPSLEPSDETASNNYDTLYMDVPRSDSAKAADTRLDAVKIWHQTLEWPIDLLELSDSEYKSFMWYCTEFFVSGDDKCL